MATSTRFRSAMLVGRNVSGGQAGMPMLVQTGSASGTIAAQTTIGVTLPAGCTVWQVTMHGTGGAGTSPIIDVGINGGDVDYFIDGADPTELVRWHPGDTAAETEPETSTGVGGTGLVLAGWIVQATDIVVAAINSSGTIDGTGLISFHYTLDPSDSSYLDPSRE